MVVPPVAVVVKLYVPVGCRSPLHTVAFGGTITTGVGLTVIVKVLVDPVQVTPPLV